MDDFAVGPGRFFEGATTGRSFLPVGRDGVCEYPFSCTFILSFEEGLGGERCKRKSEGNDMGRVKVQVEGGKGKREAVACCVGMGWKKRLANF